MRDEQIVLRARQRRASDHVGDVPNAVLTLDDLIFGVIHTIFSQIVLDAFDIAGVHEIVLDDDLLGLDDDAFADLDDEE